MPLTPPPPSCCAGLRQTLLHGWQQDFPLHPSPFRQMAARSGATPRELLGLCLSLQRSGALQPIRARWGEALQRGRWRLAFEAGADDARLAAALAALPGCDRIERGAPDHGLPTVWAELEALDEAALQRQLSRLPLPPAARLALPAPAQALACDDPALAACLEQGLPLCAKPYADCARRLGCSEQRVLASLNAWRRRGQLACLALKPTPTAVAQPGLLALWRTLELNAPLLERLQARRLDHVITAPGTPAWPWRLALVLHATPTLAAEQLRELIATLGLPAPAHAQPLRIEQPRDQALLFSG
ncbi:MAG: hypothetical protein ACK4R2_08575 [Roseateles sp.]